MNINQMLIRLLISISVAACSTALGQTQAVKNSGDKPLGVVEVYMDGKAIAGLYVLPGETMRVIDQNPISGAGYYEALPGNYYPVRPPTMSPLTFESNLCWPSLRVDKIEWDAKGQPVTITGLRPFLFGLPGPDIPITSDVKNPRIANGNLYIKLEGRGNAEYAVKIQCGTVLAFDKQDANVIVATITSFRPVTIVALVFGLVIVVGGLSMAMLRRKKTH